MASTETAAAVPRPQNFYTEPEWLDVGDLQRRLPAQGERASRRSTSTAPA